MQTITDIQRAVAQCQRHKEVHDKYLKIGWKTRQIAFAETHKDELTAYNKAYRFLKKQGMDLTVDLNALQKEYKELQSSHTRLSDQLTSVKAELKPMKDIRYWITKVLEPDVAKKPEPKHSVVDRIRYLQEQEQKAKQSPQRKQNMER